MATYQSGGVRKATPNSVAAARRSAESRKCPKCGRKSALVFYSDEVMFGRTCRWQDCDYSHMNMRDETPTSGGTP